MFRKMRRAHQQMTDVQVEEILKNADYGTLSVIGDGGYPYCVPLNFVYYNGKIYFHCAKAGHKVDAIKENSKVCFNIVSEQKVIEEKYTTYYKSVTAFGNARIVDNEKLKIEAVTALAKKYVSFGDEEIKKEIDAALKALCIIEFDIEHVTGKEYKPQK